MNARNGSVTAEGITIYIAGNISRDNCLDVFRKLGNALDGGVIWFAGCEVGADSEFCKKVASTSKAFVVAPAITLPIVAKVPPGMIDWFGESMPRVFNRDSGTPISLGAFLAQQEALQFTFIPGSA
jgi:hypothetical protein